MLLVAACERSEPTTSTDGPAVFAAYCAGCHGPNGKPPASMAVQLGVRDLTSGEFRARANPALVEAQIRSGSQNKLMPAFEGRISDAQIKAVSAWVTSSGFLTPP